MHDLLVWFEVLELAENGEYLPVSVDSTEDCGFVSKFILRQGLQRRLRVTFLMEPGTEFVFTDVNEVVIGQLSVTMFILIYEKTCRQDAFDQRLTAPMKRTTRRRAVTDQFKV